MTNTSPGFRARLEELQADVEFIESALGVWQEIETAKSDADAYAALSDYCSFFAVAAQTSLFAVIVGLWRLHESNRTDVLSIPVLYSEAASEPHASVMQAPCYPAYLAALAPILEKVGAVRHKVSAHRDGATGEGMVFAAAELTPNEIASLVSASRDATNELSSWSHQTVDSSSDHAAADTRNLIRDLSERAKQEVTAESE